jgi:cytochrome P450
MTTVVPSVDLQLRRDVETDPFDALDEYRDRDPFWAESGDFTAGGFWVITKFEQCREILQDAIAFPTEVLGPTPLLPTMAGPPELQKLRSVVIKHLTRAKVLAMEASIRAHAREYIESFAESGSCDLVSDFAQMYPIAVFCEVFGLAPEARQEFRRLAEGFLHSYHEERDAHWAAIRTIVRNEIEDRRKHPRDDLLTGIGTGVIDDDLVDLETGVNLASTVFLGGLDTLPSNLGWSFRYLAVHPEVRQRVIGNPAGVPVMVEEFLRLYSVVAKERRLVGRDLNFHGADMKKGDRLVALMSVANRDEIEFPDSRAADFDRVVNRHMAFGAGPHRCLGSHLARHELAMALTEWHNRIPDYRIADPSGIRYNGGIFAVTTLPLEWEPSALQPRNS